MLATEEHKKANAERWTLVLQDKTVGKAALRAAIPNRAPSLLECEGQIPFTYDPNICIRCYTTLSKDLLL